MMSSSTVMITTHLTDKDLVEKNEAIYWLYQITEAEAGGEIHARKVAVAAAALYRVKNPNFPNTIKEVVFQVFRKAGVDTINFLSSKYPDEF